MAALAVVAAMAAVASIEYFGLTERLTEQTGDAFRIAAQVDRFKGVAALTKGSEKLGYFHDRQRGSNAAAMAPSAAQFALAPTLLVPDEKRGKVEFWVGDFSASAEYAKIGAARGLTVAADLGSGVVVYRKAGAR